MLRLPRKPLFWAVALGHMTNDFFMNMGPVILTFIGALVLPVNTGQYGAAIAIRSVLGALTQPYFGWIADRTGGRWVGAGSVTWVVGMLMLSIVMAFQGSLWLMMIPFILSGIGSGAFHPVGAKYAAESDAASAANNMGYFFFFGQLGLALGPAVAGFLLRGASTNPDRIAEIAEQVGDVTLSTFTPFFVLSLVAIPAIVGMAREIPFNLNLHPDTQPDKPASAARSRAAQVGRVGVAMIVVLIFLRSVAHITTVDFLPRLFEDKGWSSEEYGSITSIYWLCSAVGGVFFGRMADRYDLRRIIGMSLVLGTPMLFLLPTIDSKIAFGIAAFAGFTLGGSFGIIIVLAQSILPAARGLAAGAVLGFVFTSNSAGTFLLGLVAEGGSIFGDGIGLSSSYYVIAVVAILAAILAFSIPDTRHTEVTAEIA